jgi:hypothetical protein
MVFHAGTELKDGVPHTSGGRVLCVTVLADSVKQAQQRAYDVARGDPLRRRAIPPRHRPPRDQDPMSEAFHSDSNVARVRGYLTGLQARIIAQLGGRRGRRALP